MNVIFESLDNNMVYATYKVTVSKPPKRSITPDKTQTEGL